jgi:hypothetical protein
MGCGGGSDGAKDLNGDSGSGDSGGDHPYYVLEILSPADGSAFSEGDEVFLDVSLIEDGGADTTAVSITWTLNTGDWTVDGDGVNVTDLPVGVHVLTATADVGPNGLSKFVNISVEALPINLTGSMDGKVEVKDPDGFGADDDCDGPMAFVLDGADLSGTGGCTAFGENIDFLVTGTVTDGQVSGEMGVSGGEENVPFTGTWDASTQVLTGAFDRTWTTTDGTLRIFGTFQATAD